MHPGFERFPIGHPLRQAYAGEMSLRRYSYGAENAVFLTVLQVGGSMFGIVRLWPSGPVIFLDRRQLKHASLDEDIEQWALDGGHPSRMFARDQTLRFPVTAGQADYIARLYLGAAEPLPVGRHP